MGTRNKLGYKEIERIKNDSLSTDHRPTHDEIALYNYRLCAFKVLIQLVNPNNLRIFAYIYDA